MQIELTGKERTALSLLLGLRQKFARELKDPKSYTTKEMHQMFSELIQKINKGELRYCDGMIEQINPDNTKRSDPIWDVVDQQIARSTIKRYNWKKVLGKSLTQEILLCKKNGLNVEDTFIDLKNDQRVLNFIKENENEEKNIVANLKISIHARFGENNTANKVMMSDDDILEGIPE